MNDLKQDSQSRVEDYLNDKFQNVSDLENIDSLLAKIREQQILLKEQLAEAKREQHAAEEVFNQESKLLKDRAHKHQADQTDLAKRIQILTRSEVSDDAIKKLEEPLQKLRSIEIAEEYVKTLHNAEKLEEKAKHNLVTAPGEAVAACQSLQNLVHWIEEAQPAAEGAAPHLLDELSTKSKSVYVFVKQNLEDKLKKTLDKMKWPKKDLTLAQPFVQEWAAYTKLLLELQEPVLLMNTTDLPLQGARDPIMLLPLSVMAVPLSQRFRFHFYGDKPTNRLDKPEYFFSHMLDLLDQHHDFVANFFQPLLDERVHRDHRLDLVYPDAVSCFITALLPMVSAKCLSILPQLTSQPQLMSHFVREMMSFDTTLQQSWAYSPYPGPLTEWRGLTWDMLTKHNYFDPWLKLEKDFALTRYNKIIENSESRSIDYDGTESGRTKPTKGAIRVNDLVETITDRYRLLSSFSQKMKFLLDIQLAIFDRYHNYLLDHLNEWKANSHTTGRALTGQSLGEALGKPGLESLAKIFGSAEYLERKMTEWSDDVFFLELWEELQDRAVQSNGANANIGRNLSVEEVASKTSASLRHADEILETDGGALFDETAASYRRLREQSESEIVRTLQYNARNAIRPLQNVSVWASLSTTVTEISLMAPSSALDTFNQIMAPLLEFAAKVLALAPLRRVTKQVCLTIQEELYDRLLMKHSFSAAGANQLKRDVIAITSTVDTSINLPGEAQRHFARLNDAISLLALPIRSSNTATRSTVQNKDDEDDADADADAEQDIAEVGDDSSWGLWQAEKAIFADNTSAQKALESMGLTDLSWIDARNVIKRRIEVNS